MFFRVSRTFAVGRLDSLANHGVRNSRVMQRRGSIFGLEEIAANSCLKAMPLSGELLLRLWQKERENQECDEPLGREARKARRGRRPEPAA
jgi:hypothetical protein